MLEVKLSTAPTQTGLLLPGVGVAGMAFTVTDVVPAAPVHPLVVAVTEYVPLFAVEELPIVGFCVEEEKLLGPVHE